jgi:hypothetical protein
MKKLTLLLLVTIIFHTSHSQNITAAEYFIDLDPGPGNGTAITPITPGDVVNFSTTVSTAALPDGFHFLAIRVRDANGVWSLFERRGFYISGTVSETDNITAAEYFFDADPGPGNGTALSIGTPGSVVNFTPVIPQSLSAGFHYLAIRTKDAGGKWSLFERRSFYVSGTVSPMPIITAAEYFLDTDPGRGNGTALTITTPGDIVTQTFNISLSRTISLGQHFLGIYVRDQDNNWSQFAYDTLNVKIKAPATDVTVNVAPGLCSQVVNNIDAQLLNGGDPFTYTLTGATTGSGNGNASGLSFNTGVTTVTYTLTNEPTAFSSFTVTVVDNETPTISCPSNLSMNNDIGVCGAIVNYSLPVFNDNCPGANLVRTAGPASGSVFPVGVTTVTHQVTDASGNTASCSFTVTVVDAEDPTITCPSNITVNNATGTCGATVNYTTPTFNDNCPGATINRTAGPASGSVFPVGTTTVTHVVTDAAGRTASCSFTVTVVDAEDPTITCPSNITVNNATGTCGATVNYTTPTFSDNCPGATINRTAGPASGSTFPVGMTTVTHQVTDASGNTASCSFTVTVTDAENPTISCPSNITVNNATGTCGATVNYTTPTFSDNCPGATINRTAGPASGSTFPVGMTTVTHQVTDASGNTASCSFTVTVNDTENPVISCPANITVTATGPGGTVVNYSNPTFSDNCTGSVLSQTAGLPSGSTFPIGVTTNTFLVTDASGNTNTCSFTVTVSPSLPVHLISFTAVKQGTRSLLQWVTENEVNNSHFEVQRSADGVNYTTIANKPAQNTTAGGTYSWQDVQPLSKVNYYRLKMVDIDGSYQYSVVRQVKFVHDNEILVFPSVTNNFVYIQSGKEMRAELYNISGVRLETVLIRGTSNFDMSKYPTGVYFIRVVSEYKTFKIIKH